MAFFGYRDETHARGVLGAHLDVITAKGKKSVSSYTKCTTGRKCRGSLPFEKDGVTVNGTLGEWIRFVYWDGPPDDGETHTSVTYNFDGNVYSWTVGIA